MSKFEIKMPKLGESITDATILSWSVQVGDTVREDDVLFEVNSAKVSAEIPSPVEGKVVEILFKEGDTVPVGTVVALVEMEADGAPADESPAAPAEKKTPQAAAPSVSESSADTPIPLPEKPENTQAEKATKKAVGESAGERWYSPVVLKLAQEAGIAKDELDAIPGTGFEGRLSKKDIQQYIAQKSQGSAPQVRQSPQPAGKSAPQPIAAHETAALRPQPPIPSGNAADVEIREMDPVRKIIADHMVLSKRTSPHVTTVVEADLTRLVKWREANKEAFLRREGIKLTYMPAIVEASAKALADYPQVNVSVEGYNILYKKPVNISFAVSLDDGNLITPVIHNADRLNLGGLALAVDSLAAKARAGKLTMADMEGGTFTITNYGSFGSLFGTPIINQPQVAILGVGAIEKKPSVVETPDGDMIAIRHKMYLSLSYDHRVVDGSLGGKFLLAIKQYLENWPL